MADEVASLVLRVDSTQAKGASADPRQSWRWPARKLSRRRLKVGTAGKAAATGLGAMGKAAKAAQAQTAAATLSVGEMRTAMRSLPMQMTDIAVGASTGQSPFYVLLQQGGQLKEPLRRHWAGDKSLWVAMSPASSRRLPRRPRVQSP